MNTILKSSFGLVAITVIGVLAVMGLFLPNVKYVSSPTAGAVVVGTTNSTQRIAQVVANNTVSTTYVSGAVDSGVYTMASIANNDSISR